MERLWLRLPSSIEGPMRWLCSLLNPDDVLLKVLLGAHLGIDDPVVDVGVDRAGFGVCVVTVGCGA